MFSALHDRYKSEKSAPTPVVTPPTAPPQLISASSGHSLKAYRFQSLHKGYTARGPLARALSEAPHQHDPFADESMNLFSDLDQGSQAELAGNAAELLVKATKDIAEGSQSGVVNPPKAPVVEEQLGDEMEVDPKTEIGKAGHGDKGTPSATRQSTRAKVVPIIFTAGEARSATVTRNRKLDSGKEGTRKRAKDSEELMDGDEQELSDEEDEDEIEEDRTLGLDFWQNDLQGLLTPPKRSTEPLVLACYHPDGSTLRTMDYIGHAVSQTIEYKLLYDVQHSMNAVNSRCAKDGLKFRQPPAKLPTEPPADDGFHLSILSLADWQKMISIARAQLFGTGHDLYIQGMTTANWQRENVADKLRHLHRSDAPVKVQVQGLRQSLAADVEYDYTTTIRTTTLETVLENAQNPDGLVLNALQLPSGHMVHSNPLIDSGLDLESTQMAFLAFIVHLDVAATWVFVEGPGETFWVRGRSRDRGSMADQGVDTRFHDLQDSFAFEDWEPHDANLQSCEYEGVVLAAGHGTLIMQPGCNHLVIGAPPVLSGPSELNPGMTGTLTTGGHFFCARTMHSAMCILLHLVMLQHILTNADHIGLWEVFVRITAFWLNVTREGNAEELRVLEAYLPDLMGPSASGWIEIIYLASIVKLLPALDLRHYNNAPAKDEERQEREETQ
ncbi:hypothetical protein C8R44DRAFT_881240 [Mycena epipterygia]|nr:hypothetical protein C8R44DRAFT_881240 [Mycena epipterygia]